MSSFKKETWSKLELGLERSKDYGRLDFQKRDRALTDKERLSNDLHAWEDNKTISLVYFNYRSMCTRYFREISKLELMQFILYLQKPK